MERKRKLPARAARVESVSKKRTSTPPEQQTQAPPAPPPVVEESLPKSIAPGKPLPTVDHRQPETLSSREYQSIRESGVLRESLTRSKQKWLSEGIFERYWTKPSAKKKGAVPEPANNPPKDSMTKLGTCTITVEPHIFDAVMYAIKEPPVRPLPPSHTQQPMYRPIIQYGPPNGVMPPPAEVPSQQKPFQPTHPVSQPPASQSIPPNQNTTGHNSASPAASAITSSGGVVTNGVHTNIQAPQSSNSNQNQNQNPSPSPRIQQNPAPPPVTPSPAPGSKATDPVIQMLAERAATDVDLKALMRIVANGEATSEELKKFQSHIDELTQLLKSRQPQSQTNQTPAPPPPTTTRPYGPPASVPTPNVQLNQGPIPAAPPSMQAAPKPAADQTSCSPSTPTARPEHQLQPQPQALRSKGPLPSSKPDISGIVFEFTGGSGDRFLFPKYSILEYLPGGQVIASFLIVRKGSSSDSPTYDPQLDYYQPITIRLYTHQGRQLDSLAKVVAPPDEVRRYMDDIMDNMTRAEYVLLAMRLPREVDPTPHATEKEESAPTADQPNNQVLWTTPDPVPASKMKPVKKLMSEEEQYQSFIASVS